MPIPSSGVSPRHRDALVMVCAITVLAIITIGWGERIGVNEGQGWDGQAYVHWAREFPQAMRAGVTEYQSKRVLPSAIVYAVVEVAGIEHSIRNTVVTFQVLDALSLIAAALVLYRIARALGWSRAATWAAFVLAFGSFALARQALYYPALTDTFAFLLGMLLVWAYLERRAILTAAVAAMSGFTWPALLPIALLALVLPRPARMPELVVRAQRPVALALSVAVAAVVAIWIVVYWNRPPGIVQHYLAHSHRDLLPVTVAGNALMCGAATYFIVRDPYAWGTFAYLRRLRWRSVVPRALAALAIFAAREVWARSAGTAGPGITFDEFAGIVAIFAARGPCWNVVHHVVYFGPAALLAIAVWPRLASTIAAWGPAPLAALALAIALAIDSESRILVGLWPFILVAAVDATAGDWTPRRVAAITALALAWSKLWWKLGYDRGIDAFSWPNLAYTMHDGPRASDTTFLIHAAFAAITAVVLVVMLRRDPVTDPGAIASYTRSRGR